MSYSFVFFLNSALLGVGLAMDAFSVSLANGLHEPKMRTEKCAVLPGFSADSRPLCHGRLAMCPYHCGILPVF